MATKSKISNTQIFFMLVLLLNGAYALVIPHPLARRAGADGLLCLIASTLVSLIIVVMLHKAAMCYPEETVFEYLPKIFGRIAGKLLGLALCVYFGFVAVFNLRCFVEMLVAELLPNTPRSVLIFVTILLIGWIVNNGLEDIARFSTLLAPVILLMFILVMAGNIREIQLVNLLPFGEAEASDLFAGLMMGMSLFCAVTSVLVLHPYADQPQKVGKTTIWAVLVSGTILSLMVFTILSVFGELEGARIVWPLVELARMIRIGPFLERVEAVFIAVWLSIIFINGSVLIFCVTTGLTQIFKGTNYKKMNMAVVGVLFLASLIPQDMISFMLMQYAYFRYIVWVVVAFVIILLLGALWRRKRGVIHDRTPS